MSGLLEVDEEIEKTEQAIRDVKKLVSEAKERIVDIDARIALSKASMSLSEKGILKEESGLKSHCEKDVYHLSYQLRDLKISRLELMTCLIDTRGVHFRHANMLENMERLLTKRMEVLAKNRREIIQMEKVNNYLALC